MNWITLLWFTMTRDKYFMMEFGTSHGSRQSEDDVIRLTTLITIECDVLLWLILSIESIFGFCACILNMQRPSHRQEQKKNNIVRRQGIWQFIQAFSFTSNICKILYKNKQQQQFVRSFVRTKLLLVRCLLSTVYQTGMRKHCRWWKSEWRRWCETKIHYSY